MSKYDGADSYVYPGTEVLRNKADLRDPAALDEASEVLWPLNAVESPSVVSEQKLGGSFKYKRCPRNRSAQSYVVEMAASIYRKRQQRVESTH